VAQLLADGVCAPSRAARADCGTVEGLVHRRRGGLVYAVATSRAEGGVRRASGTAGAGAWRCSSPPPAAWGALGLSDAAHPLVGGTIHLIAQASQVRR
jgi:hypothetical protein